MSPQPRRLILDTHCWIWWLMEPARLNQRVLRLLQDDTIDVLLSAASVWELVIKNQLGKIRFPGEAERFIPEALARHGFLTLEVLALHALEHFKLPPHHRDPFDRMIIAQGRMEGLPIVTADPAFKDYDAEIIWAA